MRSAQSAPSTEHRALRAASKLRSTGSCAAVRGCARHTEARAEKQVGRACACACRRLSSYRLPRGGAPLEAGLRAGPTRRAGGGARRCVARRHSRLRLRHLRGRRECKQVVGGQALIYGRAHRKWPVARLCGHCAAKAKIVCASCLWAVGRRALVWVAAKRALRGHRFERNSVVDVVDVVAGSGCCCCCYC